MGCDLTDKRALEASDKKDSILSKQTSSAPRHRQKAQCTNVHSHQPHEHIEKTTSSLLTRQRRSVGPAVLSLPDGRMSDFPHHIITLPPDLDCEGQTLLTSETGVGDPLISDLYLCHTRAGKGLQLPCDQHTFVAAHKSENRRREG